MQIYAKTGCNCLLNGISYEIVMLKLIFRYIHLKSQHTNQTNIHLNTENADLALVWAHSISMYLVSIDVRSIKYRISIKLLEKGTILQWFLMTISNFQHFKHVFGTWTTVFFAEIFFKIFLLIHNKFVIFLSIWLTVAHDYWDGPN